MAPSATNTDETPTIGAEAISKPPAGVVLPPKDIRAIVEKTAGYVARNGPVFEDRIRDKEKSNPKFSFLSPKDAYSAFYAWRLSEIRAGRGTSIAAGRPGEAAAPAPALEKPRGPTEPPEFRFSARMPNISALDLDVVRLTALFFARNGRPFLTTLSQREARNFQFDFLRPNHSLNQFFNRLVDQYRELLRFGASDAGDGGGRAERERIEELERNVRDKFNVLARARQRAEWGKYQEQQKQKKEEEEEKEKLAYAQIDWHDFVVVETVLFTEADDQAELPPPTSLSDLQSASLEQKAMMSLAPHNMRIEEAMPTDHEPQFDAYGAQQQQPSPAQATSAFQLPAPPPPEATTPMDIDDPTAAVAENGGVNEARRIQERSDARARARQAQVEAKGGAGPMKIRSDYVPRAAAQANSRRGVQMALCPNCKQQIPFNELDEHMRIELLDPRWKEQRAKAESRYATTNLSTQDVANNLKRLASQRSDVFDASISSAGLAVTTSSSSSSTAASSAITASTTINNNPINLGSVDDDGSGRRKRVALGATAGYYDAGGSSSNTLRPPVDAKEAFLRFQQQQQAAQVLHGPVAPAASLPSVGGVGLPHAPPPPLHYHHPAHPHHLPHHPHHAHPSYHHQPAAPPMPAPNVEEQIRAIHEKFGNKSANSGNKPAATSAATAASSSTTSGGATSTPPDGAAANGTPSTPAASAAPSAPAPTPNPATNSTAGS